MPIYWKIAALNVDLLYTQAPAVVERKKITGRSPIGSIKGASAIESVTGRSTIDSIKGASRIAKITGRSRIPKVD